MRPTSIVDAAAMIAEGRLTAETVVQDSVAAAQRHASLNAIAEMDAEGSILLARERDRETAAGIIRGPLHGIPVTVKDLFEVPGFGTRAGTRANLPPLQPSTAVRRLQEAGAIVIAKTNMHEVALGLTGENEWTGDVCNPHDPERQAGGSSSGSAVAVSVGIGLGSLGTDTGGSIRVPAAQCGVVGFKPTHGLVPLDGALPLSLTCDHAGPITTCMADARLLTSILAGRELPSSEVHRPRLGIPETYLAGRLSKSMRLAFERLIERLRFAGADVIAVEVPDLELTATAYTPLVRAEAAHVHRAALAAGPEGFSKTVRTALEAGSRMPLAAYLDARELRTRVIEGLRRAFDESMVDALLLPTTPFPPLRRAETEVLLEGGLVPYRDAQLALTAPSSLAGVPVAAIPFGQLEGLPVGCQLVTSWHKDARALDLATWAEEALAYH
ncbi:amidase [Sphingomonas sp. KRR8]|uniref:amidase n=1 Tax=Sphingomonas sp. KRR8 TaxID=2942996 RepID=UPI002020E53E|nr:amidase [Sphingomonas sp. KRR8]URD61157.1 amidase [Sphingomonas sp. KRR8]